MKNLAGIKKYYIGLVVLAVITLGLTIYVVAQASATKQDKKTYEKAEKIATDLNKYISQKQKIPENLSEAGITDAPSTITYEKTSAKQYKFCVSYKTARTYGGADVTGLLWGSYLRSTVPDYTEKNDNYKPSSLYLSYAYNKGENCYTVEPIIYGSKIEPNIYCDPSSLYYESCNAFDNIEAQPSVN